MEVREYRSSDCPAVIAIWQTVLPDSAQHNDPAASLRRKLETDGSEFVRVAVDGGAVVGAAMGGYDGHRGWIYSVAVLPEFHRRGIGRDLVRSIEAALVSRGCPKVNLQVRTSNASVVAFYESLGYFIEERVSMGKRLY